MLKKTATLWKRFNCRSSITKGDKHVFLLTSDGRIAKARWFDAKFAGWKVGDEGAPGVSQEVVIHNRVSRSDTGVNGQVSVEKRGWALQTSLRSSRGRVKSISEAFSRKANTEDCVRVSCSVFGGKFFQVSQKEVLYSLKPECKDRRCKIYLKLQLLT